MPRPIQSITVRVIDYFRTEEIAVASTILELCKEEVHARVRKSDAARARAKGAAAAPAPAAAATPAAAAPKAAIKAKPKKKAKAKAKKVTGAHPAPDEEPPLPLSNEFGETPVYTGDEGNVPEFAEPQAEVEPEAQELTGVGAGPIAAPPGRRR